MSLRHRRAHRVDETLTASLHAQLTASEAALLLAREALAVVIRGGRPLSEVRTAYHRVSRAYEAALAASEALERCRPGLATAHLEDLRRRRQQHLLAAPAGVLIPRSVRPVSHAAYGPHIPGMDFDPDDPTGPQGGRTWGVDLAQALDRTGSRTSGSGTSGSPLQG